VGEDSLRLCVHVWRCRKVGEHGPGSAFEVAFGYLSWMIKLCSHAFPLNPF
jgi:hypothetical protein